MNIQIQELFNILRPDQNCSLFSKEQFPLYKDSYFTKQVFCPSGVTIEAASGSFGEILDADIENLPVRN